MSIAKQLSIEAGKKILDIYNSEFTVEMKDNETPLTTADKEANEIIVDGLKKAFPQYSILSEESKDDKGRLENEWCWIVDPLDGTKEFIKRNGEFTVNIALSHNQRTVLGVIYVPVTKELYYGSMKSGSFYLSEGVRKRLHVSDRISNLKLISSRSHKSEKLINLINKNQEKIAIEKTVGSSLKGCLIAKGEADVYYRFGLTSEWDTAAMQCIVEEAGGIFKQLDGTEMIYNRENTLNEKGFYILNRNENKLDWK